MATRKTARPRAAKKAAPKPAAPWRASLARDVEGYLALLPAPERRALTALRKTIRAAAPLATETISYRIPTFVHAGPLVAFSAAPSHCALHLMSPALAAELAPYDVGTATIRFAAGRPLPARLIAKLVKARIAENERRARR